jgi:outer membrane protein TolC
MRNRILSFVAATIVSAFSSVPASQAQSTAALRRPFWQEIGDSVLTGLIVEAQRANTDVRVAEARLDATRASRRLSAFDLAPTVTASGSALRTRQSMAQVPGLTSALPQQDLYDVGFDAAWELDLFGRTRHTVNANGALVESAEHSVDDVQLSLAAEVARNYFELRGAQRQLAVAMRNADVQRKTVQLTQDRLAGGRGTAFDVERARSVLQLTLAAVPAFQTQIATGRNRIAVLLGRSAETIPAGLMTVRCPDFRTQWRSARRAMSSGTGPMFSRQSVNWLHSRCRSAHRARSTCRGSHSPRAWATPQTVSSRSRAPARRACWLARL